MIPLNLQILLIVIILGLLYFLVDNIRKYKLELKYALLWLIMVIVTLVLAIYPKLLYYISNNIFIETPVNALYLISFIIVFIILYNFTVLISKLTNQTKRLSQEIGLLKNEIKQRDEKNQNINESP
ncbi:DUF2304 domain-containing protein [Paenibacillus aceti]|uniref:DUF2304 domain-containing protein n=1 Tax=Paenibacillus aceti TaxID=1820010 RepID=A0ABQ1W8N9_9BACL|nr:hypothetical protein GCM10010913_46750 [Paenibacillus aceti]